ncbi:hypothetical protein BN7_3329 [Wickerhamomyces ciferrii]|uniref:BED-type domain-containing protein n=1 Tax=Wickerhamomyces ciferrii (strain ATCC 14091 / BCRC 22168 / CBS 111 / JCM 3599 / NBRC 0793 / NRRL Y-1031 F-60-10) TaxID=1206466 RepID=K0KF93_WICCF|nr:uncharacterized protein BN7_3329 [Wickerhamomyces ciferrii]CCH43775.1 hypothetical protein BN7_3329 [Wickerhamomyces ciferrii]
MGLPLVNPREEKQDSDTENFNDSDSESYTEPLFVELINRKNPIYDEQSKIWKFYDFDIDSSIASCLYKGCEKTYSILDVRIANSTSPLFRHLDNSHDITRGMVLGQEPLSIYTRPESVDFEGIALSLAKVILTGGVSPSMILTKENFQDFANLISIASDEITEVETEQIREMIRNHLIQWDVIFESEFEEEQFYFDDEQKKWIRGEPNFDNLDWFD